MIPYTKTLFGLNLQFWTTVIGSSFPRACLSAILSTVFYFIIAYTFGDVEKEDLVHPYAIGMIASVIGFALIFRSNSAMNRYFMAAQSVHQMYSKLGDCANQCASFCKSVRYEEPDNKMNDGQLEFIHLLMHFFSLLTATACLAFRKDHARNYCEHEAGYTLPYCVPSDHPARGPANKSWFSYLRYIIVVRSSDSDMQEYYARVPIPTIGGLSRRELLELKEAKHSQSKVQLVMFWLNEHITRWQLKGGFGKVPAPVLSRLYQEISDGMLGFMQARKIAFLPFPFVYAQMTEFLMLVLAFLVPLLMISFITTRVLGAIVCFLTCLSFNSLYEATKELEDPFLYEPNDLPILRWQSQYNEALLTFMRTLTNTNDLYQTEHSTKMVNFDAKRSFSSKPLSDKNEDGDGNISPGPIRKASFFDVGDG
jgi:predicted membrane chloride channel (bestrophin family)